MSKPISEIAGDAEDARGRSVSVYRALRPLICASCAIEIACGALFTRRKLSGVEILPRCQKCAPFTFSRSKSSSEMIRAMLEPPAETNNPSPASHPNKQERLNREVEKRLGPALARSRRRR